MLIGIKRAVKPFAEPVLRLFYTKECPVCEKKVRVFYPLPEYYREETKKHGFPYSIDDAETMNYREYSCQSCGATDRDRLYALFLNKSIVPEQHYSLLDIAPAPALRSFLKRKKNVNYRSADLMATDVDDTGVDITNMKYPDEAFDIFICSHVLEHVDDDRKAMRELHRVLKKGGFGIAMVPIVLSINAIDEDPGLTDAAERWRRFGQDDHVRLYPKKIFVDRLRESGFTVTEVTMAHFSPEVFRKNGISPKSVLYIVTK